MKKKNKKEKLYKSNKLPKLFKKTYSEKKFNSKILNKIYISADKEKVLSIFEKGADLKKPDFLAVSKDRTFTKKEIKFYKSLSKEIKKQKGLIKLIPLAAVASFITILCITFTAFKNPITKKILINACTDIFGAKTEINSVDLKIFDASLNIQGLYVGNKDSEFKNLFEIKKISLDFNLTQALRKKFYAENVEISGMEFNTNRQTSCKLSNKEKTSSQNKKTDSSTKSYISSQKITDSLSELENYAKSLMNFTDIDSLVNDILSQLQTSTIAEETYQQVTDFTEKWGKKYDELSQNIEKFAESIKKLQNINVNNIKSVDDLKSNIEKIKTAINDGEKLQNQVNSVIKEFQNETNNLKELSTRFESAVKNDTRFVSLQFSESINNLQNAGAILNSAMETVGYQILGKYYPYVKKAVNYAVQYKNSSSPKKEIKKNAKQNNKSKRMEGTTFWYSKENPTVLIKNVAVSGPLFSASIKNISSNQNVNDSPTTANLSLKVNDTIHNGILTLDVREKTDNPLILVNYTGNNLNINFNGTDIAEKSGVPSLNGNAAIKLEGTADSNGFSASGSVTLNPINLTSDGFPNKTITEYYQQALSSVDTLEAGYSFECLDSNISLNLTGNFADMFAKTLHKAVSLVEQKVKDDAQKIVENSIKEIKNSVTQKFQEFEDIERLMNEQNKKIESIQKNLDSKREEMEKQIKNQLKETAESTVKDLLNDVTNSIEKNNSIKNLQIFPR